MDAGGVAVEVFGDEAKGGEFETVSGYASKAQEQAARIAGILTLWEDLDAAEVPAETMANAIKLAYAVSPSMWVSVCRAVSLGLGLFLLIGIQVELSTASPSACARSSFA